MQRTSSDSGIQAVGEIPFGTHFCQFYRTRQDLIDTLVPFFMAGLRNNELCLWVTSEPLHSLERCCAEDVIDVCRNHQFALTRRHGDWELMVAHAVETSRPMIDSRRHTHHLVKPVDPGVLQALLADTAVRAPN